MNQSSPARPKQRVEVMECTLRDGSYTVGFQFTEEDTTALVKDLCAAGVRWIEVGHGLGLGANAKYKNAAATDEQYIRAAVTTAGGEAKVGCFFIPGLAGDDDLKRARDLGLTFIRVGTNASDVEEGLAFMTHAKELGFYVASNLMKSYVLSPFEVCRAAKKAEAAGADCVSIVDSAGGMLPDEVRTYISAVRETIGIAVGYHGHNNLGLANACSLIALQSGATFIDTTLQGIGRSAGNAWTESMVLIFQKLGYESGIDPMKLMDLGERLIRPRLGPAGSSPIDITSGYALFHSSFQNQVDEAAAVFGIDPRALIIEVCKVDRNSPSRELFIQAAARLAGKTPSKPVTFPSLLARKAKP